ncbi:MAG: adenosine kinase [Magnetovibrionaceae bacterium]
MTNALSRLSTGEPAAVDVLGIGNAIVDVLAHAEDAFLDAEGLPKGGMTLIDAGQAESLYQRMGPGVEMSGGSAANTIAALASLGGKGAFVGKVADDQLGGVFAHDIKALGIDFDTKPLSGGDATARCLILVTPDAQRTMNTFLGACTELGPDDIAVDQIATAKITYLEGYLWDPPHAKEAFLKAAGAAHDAGRLVSLSLSDPFCVERHRDSFLDLLEGHIDILFANEEEAKSLYQTDDLRTVADQLSRHCSVAAITRGADGCMIVSGEERHHLTAETPDRLADTTGAGDAFAAGFLFGLTQGKGLADCGRLGGIAAAQVIAHMGARPDVVLKDVIATKGF